MIRVRWGETLALRTAVMSRRWVCGQQQEGGVWRYAY